MSADDFTDGGREGGYTSSGSDSGARNSSDSRSSASSVDSGNERTVSRLGERSGDARVASATAAATASSSDEDCSADGPTFPRSSNTGCARPRGASFGGGPRGTAAAHGVAAVPPAHAYRSPRPRVLVTGGAGFIGSHVARALLRRGDDVVLVDELNDYYSPAVKTNNLRALLDEFGARRVHVHVADICDEQAMKALFDTENVDRVVHLAARAGVRPSMAQPLLYERTNVRGTTTLLQLSAERHMLHFVYASSSSVYGDDAPAGRPFREDHACNNPVSVYAATKKSCELLAASYSNLHKLPCSGLRFFTVYGPSGRPDMAPYLFVDRVARGETLDMFGDGTSERDYTFVDDIVQGVIKVLDHPPGQTLAPPTDPQFAPRHEVYNLGRGMPVRLRDFIATIGRALGTEPRVRQLPRQLGDVERTMADISKARRMVGYEPQFTVEEGIRRTVQWYKQHVQAKQQQQQQEQQQKLKEQQVSEVMPVMGSKIVQVSTAVPRSYTPLQSCLCATRIHNAGSGRVGLSPDVLAHLLSWVPRALACAEWVAIAVDTTGGRRDISDAVRLVLAGELVTAEQRARVAVVEVSPWGAFCPALNALLGHATTLGAATVLYSSLEMQMHPAHVHALHAQLDAERTLVVGARLPGHRFVRGAAEIDGCSTVWNTLALWSRAKLARTGFLPVSDGVPARVERVQDALTGEFTERVVQPAVAAGVEEVACISAQQLLFPGSAEAKLLSMSAAAPSAAACGPSCASALLGQTVAAKKQQQFEQLELEDNEGDDLPMSPRGGEDASVLSSPDGASYSSSCDSSQARSPLCSPGGVSTTSAAESPSNEEDEDDDDVEAEAGAKVTVVHQHGRAWPLSAALYPLTPADASPGVALYDEAPTPPQSGIGQPKRLQKRTVSAPHATAPFAMTCGLARLRSNSNAGGKLSAAAAAAAVAAGTAAVPSAHPSPSLCGLPCGVGAIPSLHWDAEFGGDAARQAAHEHKMRSKIERAAQQLAHLGLRAGTVQHVHCSLGARG